MVCTACAGMLFSVCAPKIAQWKTELLFSSDKVKSKRLDTGKSLLLLPLIANQTFDTSAALAPEEVSRSLLGTQGNIKVLFKKDLDAVCLAKNVTASCEIFYAALFKNKILEIATCDTIWQNMPTRYMIVLRVHNGVRISSFDGVTKKRGVIEGELWDAQTGEVIWRAQAAGTEMDKTVTDRQFLANGIREVFTLLPEFIPIQDEVDW